MTRNRQTIEKYLDGFRTSDHGQILSCLTEDVVVVEGAVRARRAGGGLLNAVFSDVFSMRAGLIQHLTSYLMEIK